MSLYVQSMSGVCASCLANELALHSHTFNWMVKEDDFLSREILNYTNHLADKWCLYDLNNCLPGYSSDGVVLAASTFQNCSTLGTSLMDNINAWNKLAVELWGLVDNSPGSKYLSLDCTILYGPSPRISWSCTKFQSAQKFWSFILCYWVHA